MLRSVLGTGLLVTVYRAALSVAASRGRTGRTSLPKHKFCRAERMKIDSKKIRNVKFLKFFIIIFKTLLKQISKICPNFNKFFSNHNH